MERENGEVEKNNSKDETGFSERQLDKNIEIGVFKKQNSAKVIFQKKPKK